MSGGYYACCLCYRAHKDGEDCPRTKAMEGTPEESSGVPILLRKTSGRDLRPDEDNPAKEMKLSLSQLEEAGQLKDPKKRAFWERELKRFEKKYGKESRFFKQNAIPFITPRQLERRTVVGYGKK